MKVSAVLSGYQGRIPRSTFWLYSIAIWLATWIAGVLCSVLALGFSAMHLNVLAVLVMFAPYLAGIPSWRVLLKRCHDRNHSGSYLYLVSIVPVAGPLWLAVELGFLRGTRGPNRFGPEPGAAAELRR